MLRLDNTDTLNNNRLPNTAEVTFDGGAFHYLGFNGAAASVETIGSMHFAAGQSYVQSVAGANASATNRLIVGSLTRDAGATLDFSGVGLGTTKNRVLFTQAPAKFGSNGGILPYATVTAANQDFATYTAGVGIEAYTGYETNLATAAASDIVLVTSSQTVAANKTVTGLLIRDAAPIPPSRFPRASRSTSSALATTSTATSSNNISIVESVVGNGSRLAFGAKGIIHRNAPTTIKTVIAGNTALTLSGVAPLVVEPPVGGNTYTGGTTLNSGSFTVNNNNTPLGNVAGPLNLHGGAFGASVFVGAFSIPNPLILDHANAHFTAISTIAFTGPITLTGRNIVAVPGNVTLDFVGKVSGTGSMLVTAAVNSGSGGGTLALSNAANNYSGGTTLAKSGIFASTLQLNGSSVLGSGPLFLSGGNLTAGTPLTLAKPFRLASSEVTFGGANPITLAGAVSMIGINTLSGGPTVTISGVISGTGASPRAATTCSPLPRITPTRAARW